MKTKDNLNSETSLHFPKNKNKEPRVKINKYKIFNIILIIFNIILIIIICFLVYFFYKGKAKSSNKEESFADDESNNNIIIANYSVKSGQNAQLFNPEKINLKDDDYEIEIIENNKNLGNLKKISTQKGTYI